MEAKSKSRFSSLELESERNDAVGATRTRTRVVVADPTPIVRAGLRAVLSEVGTVEIVGEASSTESLINFLRSTRPDIVIVDVTLCPLTEPASFAEIRQASWESRYVVVSDDASIEEVASAFSAGASGYVVRSGDPLELREIVRRVHDGEVYVSSSLLRSVLARQVPHMPGALSASLTRREREVLQLLVHGKNSREIANKLDIQMRTVHTHRSHIMAKFKVHTATALVTRALVSGVVDPGVGDARHADPH